MADTHRARTSGAWGAMTCATGIVSAKGEFYLWENKFLQEQGIG
ncbi:hypothetical protein Z947_3370 [Sulfitobacter geojensis]|nr:hypothetical protein Z947_3370 [Sulfitobacter geojensis]